MNRLRSAVLVFGAIALLLAGSAQAAPSTYADDQGDSVDARPSMDIVSVTYDVRQINKGGPPSLVIEMELAAPPESQLVSYETRAEASGCGHFDASYSPGTVFVTGLDSAPGSFWIGCGSPPDETGSTATLLDAQFRIVDGKVLRWSLAMDSIPKELRNGSTFSDLHAFTQIAEPVLGIDGTGTSPVEGQKGPLPIDSASTDKTWTY